MKTREIGRCACGWVAEEVVQEDIVALAAKTNDLGQMTGHYETIRCKTLARAQEWMRALRSRGFRVVIQSEVGR